MALIPDTDANIAVLYLGKIKSSAQRAIVFELSFQQFKRLITKKRCTYSGLLLNEHTRTIERLDNAIGYVVTNCITCHRILNKIKGTCEDLTNPVKLKHIQKMLTYINER